MSKIYHETGCAKGAATLYYASRSPRSFLAFFAFLALGLTLQSCMRYVPSSKELEAKYPVTANDNRGIDLAGEEEFKAYEAALRQRLDALLEERAHLANVGGIEGSYKIGPGDILAISVFGFNDMRTEAEVTPEGTVSLPLVGEVLLGEQTVQHARTVLAARYAQFIRTPKIELSLKSYQANRVSVIGEVVKPGLYPLKRNGQFLTELLSEAGGKKESAAGRLILLPARMSGPGVQTGDKKGIEIEIDELMGATGTEPLFVPLLPGDTIFVPETGTFEVDGEVDKPGSYKLSTRTSVIGAVAAAGGFTYAANVNEVEVIRDVGAGRKALVTLDLEEVGLRGGRDIRLRNGDLVRVPSEPGRFFRRQLVEALNSVFRGVGVQAR